MQLSQFDLVLYPSLSLVLGARSVPVAKATTPPSDPRGRCANGASVSIKE